MEHCDSCGHWRVVGRLCLSCGALPAVTAAVAQTRPEAQRPRPWEQVPVQAQCRRPWERVPVEDQDPADGATAADLVVEKSEELRRLVIAAVA